MSSFVATHIYKNAMGVELPVRLKETHGRDVTIEYARPDGYGVHAITVAANAISALKHPHNNGENDSVNHWEEIAQNGRAALRMMREVVELCAPIGSVASEEYAEGPEPVHEAIQLIEGVLAMRREVTALNTELRHARDAIAHLQRKLKDANAEITRLHHGDKTPKAEGEAEIARLKRGDY